jgi:hypothetical protein
MLSISSNSEHRPLAFGSLTADASGTGGSPDMTVVYRVRIDEETHHVRVEVPPGQTQKDLENLMSFALATAYLEHSGYLPRGVINAVD